MIEVLATIAGVFLGATVISSAVSAGASVASARSQEKAAREYAGRNRRRAYLASFRKTAIPAVKRHSKPGALPMSGDVREDESGGGL